MGNLKSKLNQVKSLDEYSYIKHPNDDRSDSQIQITNKLAFLLSDLNIRRLQKYSEQSKKILIENKNWQNYIFIYLCGYPPQKDEVKLLNLPGQKIIFNPYYKQNSDHHQPIRKEDVLNMNFDNYTKKLHQLLSSINPNKKIILVYHSFGSFNLGMYLFNYGTQKLNNLKGMIQISGCPLRYYIGGRILLPIILNYNFEQLLQQREKVHKFFLKQMQSTGFNLGFKDAYDTLGFIRCVFSQNYGELFDTSHHYPNILKLFIYGRNDTIFETSLLNEKVIYYAYKNNKLKDEKQLTQKFEKLSNSKNKIKNLQQRFIFGIPKGQHSLHTQQKHQQIISKAIHEYLLLIHEQ